MIEALRRIGSGEVEKDDIYSMGWAPTPYIVALLDQNMVDAADFVQKKGQPQGWQSQDDHWKDYACSSSGSASWQDQPISSASGGHRSKEDRQLWQRYLAKPPRECNSRIMSAYLYTYTESSRVRGG